MTGSSLRAAARLMATPLVGPVLYRAAIRRLGLSQIHEMDVPQELVPYRPLHLGAVSDPARAEKAGKGNGEGRHE